MADSSRNRSASPGPPKPKKQKTGGFKWKEPKSKDKGADKVDEKRYRERSPKRARSPARVERESTPEDPDVAPKDAATETPSDEPATNNAPKPLPSVADKFGTSYKPRAPPATTTSDPSQPPTAQQVKPPKEKKKKKPPTTTPQGPMIIVNVNDRLGTKAAIPCLASDSIKAFKAIVAARIGRQPHEIMLKRQGERPFKDALTLEDYGVGNGVQLDLELDTGD